MQCLKCGKEIAEGQVFCDSCLAVMAKHPVKPNTAVIIPERPRRRRSQAKKQSAAEEQVTLLQRRLMQLRLWICLLLVLLALSGTLLVRELIQDYRQPIIGQNYHSSTEAGHGGGR